MSSTPSTSTNGSHMYVLVAGLMLGVSKIKKQLWGLTLFNVFTLGLLVLWFGYGNTQL